MATASDQADPQRHVGPLLATAIIAAPAVFFWLLLRRGYSSSTRRPALTFMLVSMVPGLIVVISASAQG
jgi:hypothetical protein